MDFNYESFLKTHRKKPIFDPDALPVQLTAEKRGIEKIIPHRDPLLFIDSLTGIDVENGKIAGRRTIPFSDPVFNGHFPEYPVYPGTFAVEMLGQISLCLFYFVTNNSEKIEEDAEPASVRATRILGSYFLQPIRPGDSLTLLAMQTEYDEFMARAVGQALVGGTVSCITAGEVYLL